MKVTIEEVRGKRQLKQFIHFPEKLYKGNPNWVPALIADEYAALGPGNPSLEFCESACFLARDEKGEIVGRVAAIINHKANEQWNTRTVRFGWIDFIDSLEVCKALTDTVADWGLKRGMTTIKGPLGFTDMDKEGLLVEGFENMSPFTCIYNYPYYGEYLEAVGFVKDTDWIQRLVTLPPEPPEFFRLAEVVEQRYGLHIFRPKNRKELKSKAVELFHVLNAAFVNIYEFSQLTEKQINLYINQYFPLVNKDFICMILDKNEKVVGFAITVPSIAKAIRKSRGRLFPFGWIRILWALNHNKLVEAMLVGAAPENQGNGANVMILKDMQLVAMKYGIRKMITNPQLETNTRAISMFGKYYEMEPYMRRRCYVRSTAAASVSSSGESSASAKG